MRSQVANRKLLRAAQSGVALRVSAACAFALGVSACSSDTMRFTDAPFSSPFKAAQSSPVQRDPATTGSLGRGASAPSLSQPAPATAAIRAQPLPPPQSAVALRSAAPVPVAGNATGWSAQGGTPIVIAQGETLDAISSRYGVPRAALISANGLTSPNVAPGTRITIPVYNAAGAAAPATRQVAQSSQVLSDARSEPQRLAPARPVVATAPARPVSAAPAVDARAQAAAEAKAKAAADAQAMRESRAKFAAEAKAKADARKVSAAPAAAPPVAKPVVAEAKKPAPEKARPVVVASAPVAEIKATAIPKAAPVEEPKTTASLPRQESAAEPAPEKADFRWPARGRVIQGYTGKGGNEGINIAVPEGTPVKAAEGGTVAYAGNELKGYGNLVLIRHPNGYVSAYAHNGDLKVKRGDAVKRGQVVASSGQTGNVSSPQLHFELRKGSTPVDPTPYLNN
jgi:murein DD-endopeptidase MepM/ murein hydrolase activator NlpD